MHMLGSQKSEKRGAAVKIETFEKKPAESIATQTSLARWIGYSWQTHTTAVRGTPVPTI